MLFRSRLSRFSDTEEMTVAPLLSETVELNGSHRISSPGAPGETLAADDAEWMPGESRTRLTPDLDEGFLMDASGRIHRRAQRVVRNGSQHCPQSR